MRNEVKIGILGLVSIVLLIWGYNFLQGKNIFSSDIVANAVFTSVDGLNIAAPVTISGYKVGAVTNIKPSPDYSHVIVEMNIQDGTKIPKDARAVLVQPSLMGGKEISLKFVGDCGNDCLESGGTLQGNVSGMVDGILEVADPYLGKIDTILGAVAKLSMDDNKQLNATFKELQGVITNVKVLTDLVNNLLVSSSVNISVALSNLKKITGNIKDSNGEITSMLQNINTITTQVKDADLEKTIASAKEALDNINQVVNGLDGTLSKANNMIDNIGKITDFENQNGLVAALFNDKNFKGDIDEVVENLNLLLQDIRLHPERYKTVLSGKYKPYKPVDQDPKLKDGKDPKDQ
ncbi:MlaD family protein [Aureispira sp. CCB-E]|uniref:MlaD family protein n=1 Tax=Aureispira sp. CCB-E TaxID=3051121 RepID=UPI0028687360|nr:MlaD family protein [Aureispira sp. CCB-E]WMX16093.1 MlaD family protein [Aureispira sp. CCB-E]